MNDEQIRREIVVKHTAQYAVGILPLYVLISVFFILSSMIGWWAIAIANVVIFMTIMLKHMTDMMGGKFTLNRRTSRYTFTCKKGKYSGIVTGWKE